MRSKTISIIISTYNSPKWLEKVFWGFLNQSYDQFEIVIADDGSTDDTKILIEKYQTKLKIIHTWHEDNGFQKTKILNKALLNASSEYIIFTDGDCIPRKDFVETHVNYAQKGYYLSGGYYKLSMRVSKLISEEDVSTARCFTKEWLYANGQPKSHKIMKLTAKGNKQRLLNALTPTTPTWNGHNASGWKEDLIAINGFNEEMQYGGEDCELGDRLLNYGLKSKQIRYSAIVVHLDHKRGYKTKESMDKNKAIRKNTKLNKVIKTPNGITKLNV